MHIHSSILKFAGLVSAVVAVQLSQAQQYTTHYSFTSNIQQPIYDVLDYSNGPGFQVHDFSYGPFVQGPNSFSGSIPTSVPSQTALLVGLVDNLPNDGGTNQNPMTHVVLFMDNTAATDAENIAWGTLFRNTEEDTLISDIKNTAQNWADSTPIDNFVNGDAQTGILNPDGSSQSAWFTLGGSFTIETWSGGQIIGSGTSSALATPEPATYAVLGLGFLGLLRRRRN
jgi:hypothetical protein